MGSDADAVGARVAGLMLCPSRRGGRSMMLGALMNLRSKLTAARMFMDARNIASKFDYSNLTTLSGSDTEAVRVNA